MITLLSTSCFGRKRMEHLYHVVLGHSYLFDYWAEGGEISAFLSCGKVADGGIFQGGGI